MIYLYHYPSNPLYNRSYIDFLLVNFMPYAFGQVCGDLRFVSSHVLGTGESLRLKIRKM